MLFEESSILIVGVSLPILFCVWLNDEPPNLKASWDKFK
jgi:hypothetical protein